ncbi:MAG: hypothetical protein ACFFD4_29270 [Candidatus Odinarchaeota archaeon]
MKLKKVARKFTVRIFDSSGHSTVIMHPDTFYRTAFEKMENDRFFAFDRENRKIYKNYYELMLDKHKLSGDFVLFPAVTGG